MSLPYTRRHFLKQTALWSAAGTLPLSGATHAAGTEPVIVSLFLRGAADGLNIVVPYQDADYFALRPNIGVRQQNYTDLDGFFALNNGFDAMLPMFRSGELSFIHAAGSQDPSRSHFEAQDYMDAAAPGDRNAGSGWLHRALDAINPAVAHAGVSIGKQTNPALRGPRASSTINRIASQKRLRNSLGNVRGALNEMFNPATEPIMGGAVAGAFSSLDTLADLSSATSVTYPANNFARSLREVAALIKADIGVRFVALNLGGWDHHTDEIHRMLDRGNWLAPALAAFRQDLGIEFRRTMLLGMTEFGRTAKENGGEGSDHGHGSMMFAMGGALSGAGGGRVLLANDIWPGLSTNDLYQERYLAVTTDFRDVYAELLDRHMNLGSQLGQILPSQVNDPGRYPGLLGP